MARHGIVPLLLVSVSIAGIGHGAENMVRYEASHESMGTVFTVAVYGRDRTFLSEVVEEVFEEVDRLDEQMQLQAGERTFSHQP